MRSAASSAILLPRLLGSIEEGEAGVPRRTDCSVASAASPTLPFPASGGGSLGGAP
jgi:hypothetical protein